MAPSRTRQRRKIRQKTAVIILPNWRFTKTGRKREIAKVLPIVNRLGCPRCRVYRLLFADSGKTQWPILANSNPVT
jgi:hypothetical protein